jgi:hypothetical protein
MDNHGLKAAVTNVAFDRVFAGFFGFGIWKSHGVEIKRRVLVSRGRLKRCSKCDAATDVDQFLDPVAEASFSDISNAVEIDLFENVRVSGPIAIKSREMKNDIATPDKIVQAFFV